MSTPVLSPAEESMMKVTFKATMLRAAAIVEKITTDDVLEMQAMLLRDGAPLDKVSRVDRATLAVSHLRACASGEFKR